MNFREVKRAYVDWMAEANLDYFITMEVNKEFVGYSLPVLTKHLNHLLKDVNKGLFGANFRKRDTYLRGFVVREGGYGFPHWHLIIERLPKHDKDLYLVLDEQLPKIGKSKQYRNTDGILVRVKDRVFRRLGKLPDKGVGVLFRMVESVKKGLLASYLVKEMFVNYEGSFDKVMILTSYGVIDTESKNSNKFIPYESNSSYGVGLSMVPKNAMLVPKDNYYHPDYKEPIGCLNIYNFKGKQRMLIEHKRVMDQLKLNAEELFTLVDSGNIPHEWITVFTKPRVVFYDEEIKEWKAKGNTSQAVQEIMIKRYQDENYAKRLI